MAEMKVTLHYVSESDVIEIDDDELSKCKTEDEKTEFMHNQWREWAGDYVDGSYTLLKKAESTD